MASECPDDNREDLQAIFRERFEQWLNPICHPHVRWREVEDAREDVILCTSRLVREKKIDPAEIADRQKKPTGNAPKIPV